MYETTSVRRRGKTAACLSTQAFEHVWVSIDVSHFCSRSQRAPQKSAALVIEGAFGSVDCPLSGGCCWIWTWSEEAHAAARTPAARPKPRVLMARGAASDAAVAGNLHLRPRYDAPMDPLVRLRKI